jgi:hypothetical protein
VLDPVHYLATLGRRPAALDHAPVYQDWKLPAAFTELRAVLEQRQGALAGTRQFIRVLELLRIHPQTRVERAIAGCRQDEAATVEAIIQRTEALAVQDQDRKYVDACECKLQIVPEIQVPVPDLSRFNQLLTSPGLGGAPGAEPADHGGALHQEGDLPIDNNTIL